MKTVVLLFVLLSAIPAHAQDRWSVGTFAAGAIADDLTTWHNMQRGYAEGNPLLGFAKDSPKTVVISLALTDAVTLWIAHRYSPTHPKLVRGLLFGLGGYRGALAGRNIIAFHPIPQFIPTPH